MNGNSPPDAGCSPGDKDCFAHGHFHPPFSRLLRLSLGLIKGREKEWHSKPILSRH